MRYPGSARSKIEWSVYNRLMGLRARIVFRTSLAALAVGLLAACAVGTPTPYQPMQADGGFNEQKIEKNRYRVTFVGNTITPREDVENYLLFRIAELTLSQGYDYFILSKDDTEANTTYLQAITNYDTFDPFFPRMWPHSTFATRTAMPITNYHAQALAVMFKGTKSATEIHAYDARDVQTSLATHVRRPVAAPRG